MCTRVFFPLLNVVFGSHQRVKKMVNGEREKRKSTQKKLYNRQAFALCSFTSNPKFVLNGVKICTEVARAIYGERERERKNVCVRGDPESADVYIKKNAEKRRSKSK